MRHYFLCINLDGPAEASRHHTKREALAAFREVADEFVRFGNMPPCGVLYIAAKRSECIDDPNFYLSVGPRGGVRCERY